MQIDWKKISLKDKQWMDPYYQYEQSNSCEVSFANNFLWTPFYDVEYAIVEGMLVFLSRGKQLSVCIPMAKDEETAGNLKKVILLLEEFLNNRTSLFLCIW